MHLAYGRLVPEVQNPVQEELMPGISFETVKLAERLIKERERIAAATWDRVTGYSDLAITPDEPEEADEQLIRAIEEFRARKLAAVDAKLRELGVEVE
jgi:hypothetical protein